jgi:hypothetical protein
MRIKNYFYSNYKFLSLLILTGLVTYFFTRFVGQRSDWNLFAPSNEGGLYHGIYENISKGKLVFKDFFIEYPPLSTYFITFPMFLVDGIDRLLFMKLYIVLTGVWLIFYFIFTKNLLEKLSVSKRNVLITLSFTFILFIILSHVTFARYDLFPGILTAIACLSYAYYLKNERNIYLIWASILLALAFSVKIYPIVIAPLIFFIEIFRRRYTKTFLFCAIFALVCSISLIFVLQGRENFNKFLDYQGGRDLQLESSYASIWLAGEKIHLIDSASIAVQNGALEINNPMAKKIGKFILPAVALILISIYGYLVYILKKYKHLKTSSLIQIFAVGANLTVLVFTIFNKVFSPQYIIWLLTLIPLFSLLSFKFYKKELMALAILSLIISIFTFLIYPVFYGDLIDKEAFAICILLVRNILLVGVFGIYLRLLRHILHNSQEI